MSEESFELVAARQGGAMQAISIILAYFLAREFSPEERSEIEGNLEKLILREPEAEVSDLASAWEEGALEQINLIFSASDQIAP